MGPLIFLGQGRPRLPLGPGLIILSFSRYEESRVNYSLHYSLKRHLVSLIKNLAISLVTNFELHVIENIPLKIYFNYEDNCIVFVHIVFIASQIKV
jgi:hypothetical protein